MAIKHFCDVCGAETAKDTDKTQFRHGKLTLRVMLIGDCKDVCLKCIKEAVKDGKSSIATVRGEVDDDEDRSVNRQWTGWSADVGHLFF